MKARKEVDRYNAWARDSGLPEYSLDAHPDYRSQWRKTRKTVLERDNYTCQLCGITQKELLDNPSGVPVKDYLNVSHMGKKEELELKFLFSLCRSCHDKIDGRVTRYNENGKSVGHDFNKKLRDESRAKLRARF